MTREKKEILKKIEEMEMWIEADIALGCGFAPPGTYDDMYQKIDSLWDKLAHLSGYKNREEMEYDPRQFVHSSHDSRT